MIHLYTLNTRFDRVSWGENVYDTRVIHVYYHVGWSHTRTEQGVYWNLMSAVEGGRITRVTDLNLLNGDLLAIFSFKDRPPILVKLE